MITPVNAASPPVASAPPAVSAHPPAASANAVQPVAAASGEARDQQLHKAVDELNRYFSSKRTDLRFSVEKDLDRVVIALVDAQDGSVLRQIPSETALRIARALESDRNGNNNPLIEERA